MISIDTQNQLADVKHPTYSHHSHTSSPNSARIKNYSRTPTFSQHKLYRHMSHHSGPTKHRPKDGLLPSPNIHPHQFFTPLTPSNKLHTHTDSELNISTSPALGVHLTYPTNELSLSSVK